VIWESTNGGTSFHAPLVTPTGNYADGTDVDDVLRVPLSQPTADWFGVASDNTALGYSLTSPGVVGARNPPAGLRFGASGVSGATLGISSQEVIEAYWTDANKSAVDYYWAPESGDINASLWKGPFKVTLGTNTRLASGPGGVYLLSLDYASSSASEPTVLDVRRWSQTKHDFGAPTAVVTDTASSGSTSEGGFYEDPATNSLYVAWPGHSSKAGFYMRLWKSTTLGKSFWGPTHVGSIGGGYEGPARLAITKSNGFLTFKDSGGLELVDLSHV
jgi:hypothetical protein